MTYRRSTMIWVWTVAVLAVIGLIATIITVNSRGDSATAEATPQPAGISSGAISISGQDGKLAVMSGDSTVTSTLVARSVDDPLVRVDIYLDWACPSCRDFELQYADELRQRMTAGSLEVAFHPVAILDSRFQGSRYASRAANAAACVADHAPDRYLDAQQIFYDNQPAEGSNGLSDDQIRGLLQQAGVTGADVNACVADEVYKKWVAETTRSALADASLRDPDTGRFGTPTVLIDGKRWNEHTDLLAAITP